MKVTLRQAEPKDVVAMFDMWKALVVYEKATWPGGAAYPQLDLTNPEHVMPWFERLSSEINDEHVRVWLAEIDGQTVGYTVAYHHQRIQGEPKMVIEVREMFVKPEFRRSARVARIFERAVEGWARYVGAEAIECSCTATDPQVARWTKKGFTPYQVTFYRTAKWKAEA